MNEKLNKLNQNKYFQEGNPIKIHLDDFLQS